MAEPTHHNRIASLLDDSPFVVPTPLALSGGKKPATTAKASPRPPAPPPDAYPPYLCCAPHAGRPGFDRWLADAADHLRHIEHALRAIGGGGPPACPAAGAARLAAFVGTYVTAVEVGVVPAGDDVPENEQNELEREERRQLRELWGRDSAPRDGLCDAGRAAAILTGRARASAEETEALRAALEVFGGRTRSWLRDHRERQERRSRRRGEK